MDNPDADVSSELLLGNPNVNACMHLEDTEPEILTNTEGKEVEEEEATKAMAAVDEEKDPCINLQESGSTTTLCSKGQMPLPSCHPNCLEDRKPIEVRDWDAAYQRVEAWYQLGTTSTQLAITDWGHSTPYSHCAQADPSSHSSGKAAESPWAKEM